ncbi:MAG: hypothetical protein MHM6MM_004569 [Cercozoa sp. M6MM]
MGQKPGKLARAENDCSKSSSSQKQQQQKSKSHQSSKAASQQAALQQDVPPELGTPDVEFEHMHEGNDGYSTSSHSSDDEAGDMITPLTSAAQKMSVDDFDLLAVVGKGSFGKVMQVRHKRTGQIYAMKVLKKKELIKRKQVLHTRTERNVLVDVTHPFVVSLRAAFQTRGKLYMLLDYFNGGELFFHLRNDGQFSEERCRFYAAQIILALKCLHENGVVYRDLKPENILLDSEGFIKITDFGLSKDAMADGKLTHTFCGTPEYLAPEVLRNEGHARAVDWWSLGTLLFEMMTGLPVEGTL